MKFIIDENLPPRLANWLRERGHDVLVWRDVRSTDRSDNAVARLATAEGRVIVTKDNDFEAPRDKERVLHLCCGNCSTVDMLAWLAPRFDSALSRLERGEVYVEVV